MIAVRVVQTTVDQIIDVIAMRDRLVAAIRPVNVPGIMARAGLAVIAGVRVLGADLDDMLVDMIAMRMMEMAIMQIIHMVAVADGSVAAALAVLMRVIMVDVAIVAHGSSFLNVPRARARSRLLQEKECDGLPDGR